MFLYTMFVAWCAGASPLNKIGLSHEMDVGALETMNKGFNQSTNGVGVIMPDSQQMKGELPPECTNSNGLTFHVLDDGKVKFNFKEEIIGYTSGTPLQRTKINDTPISDALWEMM